MRRPRQTCNQRHWHSQNQRVRRGHHQNRHRADRVAGEPSCRSRKRDRNSKKKQRVSVGKPRHGRFGRLRRLDQPDDPGLGAVAGSPCDPQIEDIARVG
jgi:hypothetical protein